MFRCPICETCLDRLVEATDEQVKLTETLQCIAGRLDANFEGLLAALARARKIVSRSWKNGTSIAALFIPNKWRAERFTRR
jgi:hypothetical protein